MGNVGEIIAIGGGGFGRNPNNPIIEKYIVDQCENEKPNVLFILRPLRKIDIIR